MGCGLEFVYRQIINADEANGPFDKERCTIRFKVHELFVEFPVLPMIGIFGLEQNAFDSVPFESFQV